MSLATLHMMPTQSHVLLLVVIHSLLVAGVICTVDVWPIPTHATEGTQAARLVDDRASFVATMTPSDNMVLNEAVERCVQIVFMNMTGVRPYENNIFVPAPVPSARHTIGAITGVEVSVLDANVPLSVGVDESYTIDVPTSGVVIIRANTLWGSLRALETFSQLAVWTQVLKETPAMYVLHTPLTIEDAPRYPWRGLMVDVSRHFLPIETLQHTIDVMSYNKLNVLHLHMSDAESFPYVSKAFPELAEKGAYSPAATYTAVQLSQLETYANMRGVIVIPELDTPGHVASWGKAFPNITTDCWDYLRDFYRPRGRLAWPNWDSVPLAVSDPQAKVVTEALIREFSEIFTSGLIHLGGDEVISKCWAHDATGRIHKYMDQLGLYTDPSPGARVYDYAGLQDLWSTWVLDLAAVQLKQTVILWEEAAFGHTSMDFPADTIVQAWQTQTALFDALRNGFKAVTSFGLYLDRQAPTCVGSTCRVHWMWQWTWHDMYEDDPMASPEAANLTQDMKDNFLGGELCSWGESVDKANIDDRLWSRGPAASERLWSVNNPYLTSYDAQPRFSSFRCKMLRRGVMASPSEPDYCDAPVHIHEQAVAPTTNGVDCDIERTERAMEAAEAAVDGLTYAMAATTVILLLTSFGLAYKLYQAKQATAGSSFDQL